MGGIVRLGWSAIVTWHKQYAWTKLFFARIWTFRAKHQFIYLAIFNLYSYPVISWNFTCFQLPYLRLFFALNRSLSQVAWMPQFNRRGLPLLAYGEFPSQVHDCANFSTRKYGHLKSWKNAKIAVFQINWRVFCSNKLVFSFRKSQRVKLKLIGLEKGTVSSSTSTIFQCNFSVRWTAFFLGV